MGKNSAHSYKKCHFMLIISNKRRVIMFQTISDKRKLSRTFNCTVTFYFMLRKKKVVCENNFNRSSNKYSFYADNFL